MHNLSLDLTASQYPDNVAVCSSGETITYRQLSERVHATAQLLRMEGITQGNSIGIVTTNSIDTIVTLYSLWQIGAVVCLLNRRWPQNMIADACKTVDCKLIDIVKSESGHHQVNSQVVH